MAKKKIKAGVIGLGRIAWSFHCPALHKNKDIDFIAAADMDKQRLQEAHKLYACESFTDYKELLNIKDLDLVVIASPTHLHKKMTLEALKKGLNVALEKPMAKDLKEAKAILTASKKSKGFLTIYQPHRIHSYFQHIKKIIKSGKIGKFYLVKIGGHRFVRRNDWQALTKYGGGMLNNYGAHNLDMILQLIGYDIAKVFCHLRSSASLGDAEDVVKGLFETKKGIVGELDINQASTFSSEPFLQCWGTQGSLKYNPGAKIELAYFKKNDLPKIKLETVLSAKGRKYPATSSEFRRESLAVNPKLEIDFYKDIVKAMRLGKKPYIKAEEVFAVMELMEQCRKSSGKIY